MDRLDEIQAHFTVSPKSGQYDDLWGNYLRPHS
jgi:hypothetical protein